MRCAIMQPTYFPWAGYFNLMTQVDMFVFLDDVQFEKRSWQSRNRVLVNGEPHWITVPVKLDSRSQIIQNVIIDDEQPWRDKHCKLLKHTYAKHPFRNQLNELIGMLSDRSISLLSDLNIQIIQAISSKLGITVDFYRASELKIGGKRSKHLLDICSVLSCSEYVSPIGSREYLEEDKVFEQSKVQLFFQNYLPPPYLQQGMIKYVSHLSIIDVIANMHWNDAAKYIMKGE